MEKKLIKLLSSCISKEKIAEHALEMHRLEGNCSHSNFKASTDYAMKCMKEAGFSDVKRTVLAADGKTAHFDCIMPQAWEMKGRAVLRLEDKTLSMEERTLADSDKDPYNSGIWGCGTPKEGVKCRIIDIDSVKEGDEKSMKGNLVLINGSRPQYRRASDAGALGVIICDSKCGDEYPDHCRWSNGIGFTGWYHSAEERKMVIFCITPRKAAFLRERLAKGPVRCFAQTPARIYDGEVYTVSGLIKGKSKEEMTFLAHMYEPFVPDDAAGGMVAIELCRALKELIDAGKLPPLQKTLKVVLSMECYGFYEYFEKLEQRKKILSIFSLDSCCHLTRRDMPRSVLRKSTYLAPFFGDCLFEELFRKYTPQYHYAIQKGSLSDDTFSATSDWGIPAIWPHNSAPQYHHNAGPAFHDADFDLAYDTARFVGTLTGLLALTEKKDDLHKLIKKVKKLEKEALLEKIVCIKNDLHMGRISLYDVPQKIRFYGKFAADKLMSFNRFWKGSVSEEECSVFVNIAEKAVKALPKPQGEQKLSPAEKEADLLVVKRLREGIFMSLAAVPLKERHKPLIPDLIYMSLDGKRSLREAVKLYEFENDMTMKEADYLKFMNDLAYLEKHKYVKLTRKKSK